VAINSRKFGGLQVRVAAMCTVITGIDGYDIASAGFSVPVLSDLWHLPPQAFTQVLVLGSIGLFFGALLSGPAGDWFGRKPSLIGAVFVFGLFSVLSALSGSLTVLTLMRFLTGLGLGAAIPLTVALVSDYTPRARHAAVVASMATGFPLGALLGGLVAAKVVQNYGWQSVYLIGGVVPLLYVPFLIAWLPESLQFLVRRDGISQRVAGMLKTMDITLQPIDAVAALSAASAGNPVFALFSDGFAVRTILLWIVFAMNFLTTYCLLNWLPSLFHSGGMTNGEAIFATTMFQPGGLIGGLLIGHLCDRFGAERTLVVTVLIGAVFVVLLGFVSLPFFGTVLVMMGIGFGNGGSQMSMNALAGAVYPPQFRSTGTGWALGIGRLGNIFGPWVGGIMLSFGWAPQSIILTTAVPVLVVAAALTALRIVRSADAAQLRPALPSVNPVASI
jgi:AAHS family 4-hydroxybenzoate transporter-like MFS transporter